MNLEQLQSARAHKIYEYGELSYEQCLLDKRLYEINNELSNIVAILNEIEQQIDNYKKLPFEANSEESDEK
jgi:hypothetical protein